MEKEEKLAIIEEILIKISSSVSPHEVLDYLIDKCIEITGALTGSIMLINPETKTLEIKTFRGLHPSQVATTILKVGEGVTGMVAKTGKPVLINNTEEVDYYVRIRDDLKAELAVPLKLEQKTIGVINVDSNNYNNFTEEHLDILNTISAFAAQILHKANLIEALKDKIVKQNLLLEIADILGQELELSAMFNKIMNELSETIIITRGMLVLLNEDDELKIFAGYKLSQEAMARGSYQIGEGVIGKVYKYGESIAIKNVLEEKDFLNRMKIWRGKGGKYSFFAVPIKYEHRIVGVFSLERKYVSEEDFESTLEVVTLIATLVSNRVYEYVKTQRERNQILRKNIELKQRLEEKEKGMLFIGKNKRILEILETVNIIADTDATIIITGETGTGKEILAHLIHNKSRRWDKPFISINCAAIPENLLESELFGYKRGSFTGAASDKKGKFLLAHKGTIFLDEIGDLSLPLQAKILRVLQEKVVEPLGSEKGIEVDVRIISATNKNIKEVVDQGQFRGDLYYRLNVIHIELPSLLQRRDDIPLFINHFIAGYNKKYNKNVQMLTPHALEALINYSWPGNIRELQNVIERAVILCNSDTLDISNLAEQFGKNSSIPNQDTIFEHLLEKEITIADKGNIHKIVMDKIEKYMIEYALIKFNHKQTEVAGFLGIHRNTLRNKIAEYSL